jgi:predicted Zn-dependent protease
MTLDRVAREDPEPAADSRLIELGWLSDGGLSRSQREAVRAARDAVAKTLADAFPRFRWHLPVVPQAAMPVAPGPDEPATRLAEGVQERDARAWDFAFVVTPRDLQSYYKSYALAVPSRALAVGVLSLARLAATDDAESEDAAADVLSRRIAALALHLFGDLNGLWHRDDPDAAMQAPRAVGDLDRERTFGAEELLQLARALSDVADLRLEETSKPPNTLRFYLRASFERAGEIGSAVLQARPWEFPLRLSRLTTAAFSALFVLLVTAEVWDLGASQRPWTIGTLSILVVGATTAFILARQKLILRRARGHISEQAVVMNVSAALVVLLGMITTYVTLFGLTVALGLGFFGPELIARWAPTVESSGTLGPLLATAGLVASLGLLIGSLGASFEGHHYFRHVIYADEET